MFRYYSLKANEDGREELRFNQFIAGALCVFKSIDFIDLSLLVEDIEAKEMVWICGDCSGYKLPPEITGNHYIRFAQDGTIMFKDGYDKDYFCRSYNRTIGDILKEFAGDKVNNYFENLDVNEFVKRKAEIIEEYKVKALEKANILLISDNESLYKELKKYGFKNVEYFASLVRADNYFREHKEELDKFHLILQLFSPLNEGMKKLELQDYFLHCDKNDNPQLSLTVFLSENSYSKSLNILSTGYDEKGHRNLDINVDNYSDFFNIMVGNMLINRLLERHNVKEQEFKKHVDYINPNKLPLPKKKNELKILYCPYILNSSTSKTFKELGLDISGCKDNNYNFDKNIKTHLGDYDIIIARKLFSNKLIDCNNESTEQCKDTGRQLTLLVTYEDENISLLNEDNEYESFELGTEMKMFYRFGGSLAPDSNIHKVNCRVAKLNCNISDEEIAEMDFAAGTNKSHKKFMQMKKTRDLFILQTAVNLYNEALLKANEPSITDLDFKTLEDFEKEYDTVYQLEQERIKQALAPIEAFDQIIIEVKKYLTYKKRGLVPTHLDGLIITENDDKIKVENIINGRVMCTIEFSDKYVFGSIPNYYTSSKNMRLFDIQVPTKKGSLSPSQRVGVYTKKYEQISDLPPRPDEKQATALNATLKKVTSVLKPVNELAEKNDIPLGLRKKY